MEKGGKHSTLLQSADSISKSISFVKCFFLLLIFFCHDSEINRNPFFFLYIWFDSFVQEFVAAPLDGVSLLLEVLRSIQLSQQNGMGQTNTTGKMNAQTYQRRALLDELACLYVEKIYVFFLLKRTLFDFFFFAIILCVCSHLQKFLGNSI